jgi:hypothetical protein
VASGAAPAASASAGRPPPASAAARAAALDSGVLSGLSARNIGSATMSGRVSAVAARNSGGKTTNRRRGERRRLEVGRRRHAVQAGLRRSSPSSRSNAVTIDPSNPKTVWVGTGESWMRNSVSVGDGIT